MDLTFSLAGRIIIIVAYAIFAGFIALQGYRFRKRGIDVLGREPIGHKTYLVGKTCSVLCWAAMVLQALGAPLRWLPLPFSAEMASVVVMLLGFSIMFASYLRLGESLRFGTPREDIALKTTGIYALSRNPMYLSFYLTYLSSVLYTLNPFVLILGAIAAFVHHRIALAEESFLAKRFGKAYRAYASRVPRYL